ncbi:MAG: DUF885 domain-containing protein [Pseudomonadota bacterium]
MSRAFALITCILFGAAGASIALAQAHPQTPPIMPPIAEPPTSQGAEVAPPTATDPATALHALFEDEWEFRLRENPLLATSVGDQRYDHLLPGAAPRDHLRRAAAASQFQARLGKIDRDALSEADKVNYDVFAFMLHHRVDRARFRAYRIPLNSDSGFYMTLNWAARSQSFRTIDDYQAWLRRLSAFPRYMQENVDNMRQGLADGFTLPAIILQDVARVIESMATTDIDDSPLYRPFLELPPSLDDELSAALPEIGRYSMEVEVMPALREFHRFFVEEYIPGARDKLGASELPEGEAYYAGEVRFYTNLNLTPEQVHQTGLDEVARIRAQMEAIIEEVGFEGSFAEFLAFLRSDPQFYVQTPRELLMHASYLAKKADGQLPKFFGKLPRQPYTVAPVPLAIAPNYTSGRYSGAPLKGSRSGEYWVNTYALDKRTLYTLPALTLHEAVPGHHLQNALAKELEGRPNFRRFIYPHAFGEGWGLYSEKLGVEMGMYETPYEDFGRLTYEMWRACRLVVDTGMHAKGWSRQEALDYLSSNTALSTLEVRTEIDRYIAWPGQALAYKVGELKIIELRERAREALGTRFDIREFHDRVLSEGGVPLPVLEGMIDRFIEERLGAR